MAENAQNSMISSQKVSPRLGSQDSLDKSMSSLKSVKSIEDGPTNASKKKKTISFKDDNYLAPPETAQTQQQ